jgi:hypothetical protein
MSERTICLACGKFITSRGLSYHLNRSDECRQEMLRNQYNKEPTAEEKAHATKPAILPEDQNNTGTFPIDENNLPVNHPMWDNAYYERLDSNQKTKFRNLFATRLWKMKPNKPNTNTFSSSLSPKKTKGTILSMNFQIMYR